MAERMMDTLSADSGASYAPGAVWNETDVGTTSLSVSTFVSPALSEGDGQPFKDARWCTPLREQQGRKACQACPLAPMRARELALAARDGGMAVEVISSCAFNTFSTPSYSPGTPFRHHLLSMKGALFSFVLAENHC